MDRITHEQIDRIEDAVLKNNKMLVDLHKRMFPELHESEETPKTKEETV